MSAQQIAEFIGHDGSYPASKLRLVMGVATGVYALWLPGDSFIPIIGRPAGSDSSRCDFGQTADWYARQLSEWQLTVVNETVTPANDERGRFGVDRYGLLDSPHSPSYFRYAAPLFGFREERED
jgi:hypothetical protein